MLLGNYAVLLKSPGRYFGGSTLSEQRSNFNTSGSVRGRFVGWADLEKTTSVPEGTRPPITYVIPLKSGGLSSIFEMVGDGDISNANLAGGRNASATIAGTGSISNAALGLIVSAVATIAGSGSISADIKGKLEASATIACTGSLTATIKAFASAVAALNGSGSITTPELTGKGYIEAEISPFTELSPQNLANAVWNALVDEYNNPGTMGQAIYTAKLALFDDDAGTTDRYVVTWFRNGEPVTSGITSPTIQVLKVSDGSNLIASTSMTQIATSGRYRYSATGSERITSGLGYIVVLSATIDGVTRTWDQPVGRDST